MSTVTELLRCPAPAKLNLFLHITGRRTDGYHLLQSVFQLIDWCDYLDFYLRVDGQIRRINTLENIPDNDLTVRAAQLLKTYTGCRWGVDIVLDKQLPIGGGVGGGSSDAATTLLALNKLWNLQLTRTELMKLGVQLGADIPFFIFGQNAFVEGIGEQMQALELPARWFTVIFPAVSVSTASIFLDPILTRDAEPVRIADFLARPSGFGRNDLQVVVEKRYQKVADVLKWLRQYAGDARMTGSGSCVFAACSDNLTAQQIARLAQQKWLSQCAVGIAVHPLIDFAR